VNKPKIQVDVWGGELHQFLVRSSICHDWADVSQMVETECESGQLVNILCLDFKTPPERQHEIDGAMKKLTAIKGDPS
jgi:hypothetical protein